MEDSVAKTVPVRREFPRGRDHVMPQYDPSGTSDHPASRRQRIRRAIWRGAASGLPVGILTACFTIGVVPTGSGESTLALAFLGPAIRFLLGLPIVFCPLCGILGAALRPSLVAVPVAVLLVWAVGAAYLEDPLLRRMGPCILSGLAVAVLAGAGERMVIERKR